MGKFKFSVSVGDILFCISMTFVLGFPNPSVFKALSIIAFFGYTLVVSALRKIRTKNALQYIGWFSFFAFCNLSKMWLKNPAAAEEVLPNVLWCLLISIAIVNYISIYKLSLMDLSKRILVIILIFFVDIMLNGGYVDGRYTVVIGDYLFNENMFGQTTVGFAAYMMYWLKKSKRNNVFIGGILLALVILSLMSGSRRAFVSLIIYIMLFALCEYPPKSTFRLITKILAGVVFVGGIYVFMMSTGVLRSSIGVRIESLFDFFGGNDDADGSLKTRVLMLHNATEMFFEKPILGHGLNAFAYVTDFGTYAHNNYMDMLANVGMVGTALYYIPLILYFAKAYRCWKNKYEGSIFPLAVIGIYLLNDIAVVSYYSIGSQAFLAIAIGLCINMCDRSEIDRKEMA